MTSIRRPQASYANQPKSENDSPYNAKQVCLIVGLTCLAGFCIDTLTLGLPPSPFNLQWRVNFLQQVGDRSIILLFGSALLLYSQLGNRRLTRPLSLICLGVGVAFMLSCILIIRDSLILQEQAVGNITTQAEQLQAQIEESKGSPELLAEVTPEQIAQAEQQLTSQAEQLKQNAQTGITKAGLASIGNLIAVGAGLVGLGRFGLTSARRMASGR
ncbi:HpsJ family protein [Leptolyngbya sp. BC1307]|uniref:HpsJ-like protein, cyanoexosortase C-associated n=1 Tax=Leptolyngbya sp. BC1307 TaxID=2029589 RepID=UPI000EFCCD1F|nr:HpsJ family protein [Leptolyngbya sp. BC1307]